MANVTDFDSFCEDCEHRVFDTDVNNGYGCNHPENESYGEYHNDDSVAACYTFTCPICSELYLDEPEDIPLLREYLEEDPFEYFGSKCSETGYVQYLDEKESA